MKYLAYQDQYVATAEMHRQSLLAGDKGNLYPQGVRIQQDGSVEMPDEAAEALQLRAGEQVSDTVETALSRRFNRPQPKPRTIPRTIQTTGRRATRAISRY